MNSLPRSIPRTFDDPVRILGLAPMELAACALTYALLSPALRGVPFATVLSLTLSLSVGLGLLILNRAFPPAHGIYYFLWILRPKIHLGMGFGPSRKEPYERY